MENQLENINFSFASTLEVVFSSASLRLAKMVRRAQAQFELYLEQQVESPETLGMFQLQLSRHVHGNSCLRWILGW